MTAKRFAFVLLDDFADWEGGLLAATARAWLGAEVRYFTPGGRAVRSMGGLTVTPDAALETLTAADCDCLVLIGSSAWEAVEAPDVGPLIRQALARDVVVGAICGATLAVARSGVANNRPHTSNAAGYLLDHAKGYVGTHYVDTPRAVVDGRLVTAPGSAPVTFALGLLGQIFPGNPGVDQIGAMIAAEHKAG